VKGIIMDWKDIAKDIAKVAPALGTVIGGPVGGAVGTGINLLANALGVKEDPEEVMAAIKADPSAYQKIKQAELDNEAQLQTLVYQTIQAGYETDSKILESLNKADASGHSTRPKIAWLMAWMLAIPYCLIGAAIVYAVCIEPTELKNLWPVMLAYLSVPLGILNKYFGDLRKEHAQARGQQVDFGLLGNIFGAKK